MMWIAYKGSGNYAEAFRSLEIYVKEKESLVTERQQQQLNEMVGNLQVKEKDLTIANQQLDITRKKKNMQVMILAMVIGVLLVSGQFIYILKTRRHRTALFKKGLELDREIMETRYWLEWRKMKEEEARKEGEHNPDAADPENGKTVFSCQTSLYTELRDVFDEQKLYLDPELNIKTVIKVLGTNQKYLYQAISENSENNFRSFLNRYRVDEAKWIIERSRSVVIIRCLHPSTPLRIQLIGLFGGGSKLINEV